MFRQVAVKSSSAPFSTLACTRGGVAPQRHAIPSMVSVRLCLRFPYFTVLLVVLFWDRASPDLFFETKFFGFVYQGLVGFWGEIWDIIFPFVIPPQYSRGGAVG